MKYLGHYILSKYKTIQADKMTFIKQGRYESCPDIANWRREPAGVLISNGGAGRSLSTL